MSVQSKSTDLVKFNEKKSKLPVKFNKNEVTQALELVDTPPPVIGDGDNARMDNSHVNWMRSRADLRLKLLAKWYPQEYGDRVGIDGKADINLTISTGVPQA